MADIIINDTLNVVNNTSQDSCRSHGGSLIRIGIKFDLQIFSLTTQDFSLVSQDFSSTNRLSDCEHRFQVDLCVELDSCGNKLKS